MGSKGPVPRPFPQPLWLGESDLTGKTILVHAEQGLGDTLQFLRYVPSIAARGGAVVLEVQPALLPLLAAQPQLMAHLASLHAYGDALPHFDCHCPLLSLPLALGTMLETIPGGVPYIDADPARVIAWRTELRSGDEPRIGLVWAGAKGHANDRNRSLPLTLLRPLLQRGDLRFVALQREQREGDAAILAASGVVDAGGRLETLADTTAIIAGLDLVITVDTSIAHLAGAMGKPIWVLLPFCPDFRWLIERDDSPWYPSARLFRQTAAGDWAGVVKRVSEALVGAAGSGRHTHVVTQAM
jgi:hypothetical protein